MRCAIQGGKRSRVSIPFNANLTLVIPLRMTKKFIRLFLNSLMFFFAAGSGTAISASVEGLYQQHCAQCHHAERLGGIGPALLPQNLKRLKKEGAVEIIKNGRAATQMPAFSQQLNTAQIGSLVEYIFTPLAKTP
jgi:mono/diheme cytochrome c family protein